MCVVRLTKTVLGRRNRGPLVSLEHKIQEEVWSGNELKFSHLSFWLHSICDISDQGRNKEWYIKKGITQPPVTRN